MRARAAAALLALALTAAAAGAAAAGAWLQEPGTAYLRLSAGLLSTRERFDPGGHRVPFDQAGGGYRDTRYRDLASTLYAEVGVAPGWNLVAASTWKRLRAVQPSAVFTTYGFSDLSVGVKRGLYRGGRAAASVLVSATVPTGYDPSEYPALGSNVADYGLAVSAGGSAGGFWGTGDLGYLLRGGPFRDQVTGSVGGGFAVGSRIGIRAEARGGLAVGPRPRAGATARFDPAAVDPSHLELAETAAFELGRGVAVEAEARTTVWGENTLTGTRWSLALATSPALRWRR